VTPAIDLIERMYARVGRGANGSAAKGNTSLASTVQLTTALRHDINEFGKKVCEAAEAQSMKSKGNGIQTERQIINAVLDSMRDLLRRIEDVLSFKV
jgi:RanGTP-binding protein